MAEEKKEKTVDLTKRVTVEATDKFPGREKGEKFKLSAQLVDSFQKKGYITKK